MPKNKTIWDKLDIPNRPCNITFEISTISHLKLKLLEKDTGQPIAACLNKLIHSGFQQISRNNESLLDALTGLILHNNLDNKQPFKMNHTQQGNKHNDT